MKRSCPSARSISLRKLSRQKRGATSGSSPSTTSTSANAASSESATRVRPRSATAARAAARSSLRSPLLRRRGRGPPGAAEIAEEFRARLEHHQVALVAERRLVRFEAAIERVELLVHAVGRSVDCGGLRVAVALDLL